MEAEGYRSFHLVEVRYVSEGVAVRIDDLSIPQPWPWVRGMIESGERRTIRAGHAVVHFPDLEAEDKEDPAEPLQLIEILEMVRTVVDSLPDLAVESLTLTGKGEAMVFPFEDLTLRDRLLSGTFAGINRLPETDFSIRLDDPEVQVRASLKSAPDAFQIEGTILPAEAGWSLVADLTSRGNPLSIQAAFTGLEPIPESMQIDAEDWPVPAFFLLPDEVLPPGLVLSIKASSVETSYEARIRVDSGEKLAALGDSLVVADFQVQGNEKHADFELLQVRADWFNMDLSEPVRYTFDSLEFSNNAKLDVQVDLDRQAMLPVKGRLSANLEVFQRETGYPDVAFSLEGGDLQYKSFPLEHLILAGSMDYPVLEISRAILQLGENSSLNGHGSFDTDSSELDATLDFNLSPAWLARHLEEVEFTQALEGVGHVKGPLDSLTHEGTVDVFALEMEGLHPLKGALRWKAPSIHQIEMNGNVETSAGGLAAFGLELAHHASDNRLSLTLASLELTDQKDEPFILDAPVEIQMKIGEEWALEKITPLNLGNSTRRVSGSYAITDEEVSLVLHEIELRVLDAWLTRAMPALVIDDLRLRVSQMHAFIKGDFDLAFHGTDDLLDGLEFRLSGALGENGLALEAFEGWVAGEQFSSGRALLPIRFSFEDTDGEGRLTVIRDGPLEGEITAGLSPGLIRDLEQVPFISLTQGAELELTLAGSLDKPEARLVATLNELDILHLIDPQLEDFVFDNISVSLDLTPDQLIVEQLRGHLGEARLALSGNVSTDALRKALEAEPTDWVALYQELELQLALDQFQTRNFTPILPGFLRPTGHVSGRLVLNKGGQLGGHLLADAFSIRPTLISQSISRIRVTLEFEDRLVTIRESQAFMGESRVEISGFLDLEQFDSPLYSIQLSGSRTPLVRTPELLLLTDLNLSLDRDAQDSPSLLSGSIKVRDSIVLMDIDPLAARTAGANMPKPPFFSIGTEPYSHWLLDIGISGDESIRFRSQYATALLSASFQLDGTLENPVLVGNLNSNDGSVYFPGTRLSLSNSQFFITRNRQDLIQLDLNAVGQTSSYVVTMQVRGNASEPLVEFASTPFLTTTQVLQLLATGSTGGGGLGSVGIYLGRGILGPGPEGDGLLNRLTFEMGRDVTESGTTTMDAYFRLNERLRLHGEYDKYDAQNLNLEWEIYSK